MIIKKVIKNFFRYLGFDLVRYKKEMKLTVSDFFMDSFGNEFEILNGYRDVIKPGWQGMFDLSSRKIPTINIDHSRDKARRLENLLNIFNYSIKGKTIMEIGCYGGADSFAMVELGAEHVDAIDIPEYFILQEQKKVDNELCFQKSNELKELRSSVRESFNLMNNGVSFFDLNVLEVNFVDLYDIIFSYETLEHIMDPQKAINNIFKALKPGGVSFHEWNPFFALDGGHSLCTLDFPYGHARLSQSDFERYIEKYRPQEYDVALNFYNFNLNRMTLADVVTYSKQSGFEILFLYNWADGSCLDQINKNIFSQCKALYPSVSINDLISSYIWILLKKPAKINLC